MIEGGKLKLRINASLERRLLSLADSWGLTPEEVIREMLVSDWGEDEPQKKTGSARPLSYPKQTDLLSGVSQIEYSLPMRSPRPRSGE